MFLTKWVGWLTGANVAIYLLTSVSRDLAVLLALFPPAALARPWSVVTYMFVHANFMHLFFNMVGLAFFGPRLESRLGSRGFLTLYFLAGLGGAVLSFVFARDAAVVGASGAVYGVLMGFAMFWPHERMIVFPIPVPLEARVVIGAYLVLSLVQGFGGLSNGIAHFAHLGGAVFAFAYLKWAAWHQGQAKREFQQKMRPDSAPRGAVGDQVALARWRGISVASMHELNRGEVERLLDKAERDGPTSLTQSERDFMDRMSVR
ncbi:MAG: rhomboid family intramembrane serine protease [Gemmatimonadetes bacterium]|nr:rhomboid family intramembrane serine protease [Gemmatimonadota bacterium]